MAVTNSRKKAGVPSGDLAARRKPVTEVKTDGANTLLIKGIDYKTELT